MSRPFSKHKAKLRGNVYNLYRTHLERKAHVPEGIKAEDWVKYCDNENTDKAIKMKSQNKKNRGQLKHSHCSGLQSHARVRAKMKKLNPTKTITRDEVWEITHIRVFPSDAPLMVNFS